MLFFFFFLHDIFSNVVKTGPALPFQPKKSGTGQVEPENPVVYKNRDKTGHPVPVEPVTRMTRCRVSWFLLFLPPLIMRRRF